MRLLDRVHTSYVFPRRVEVLSALLDSLLPPGARVLDVGAGDGRIALALLGRRPDLSIQGIDVLVRENAQIEVAAFDGTTIPFPDSSFDAVMLVDVVHHAEQPELLLREAARVASARVVVKDHLLEGPLAGVTLRFMDGVGNRRHGVALPHTYWPRAKWLSAIDEAGLRADEWRSPLKLYPWPAGLLFDRSLHFAAALAPAG